MLLLEMLECDLPKKTDPFIDFNFTALELLTPFETRIASYTRHLLEAFD